MKHNINFKIIDFNSKSKNIINSKLLIYNDNLEIIFKISNFLGKGSSRKWDFYNKTLAIIWKTAP